MNKWKPRVTQRGDHWKLVAVRDGGPDVYEEHIPFGPFVTWTAWRSWGTSEKSLARAFKRCTAWCDQRNDRERIIADMVDKYAAEES